MRKHSMSLNRQTTFLSLFVTLSSTMTTNFCLASALPEAGNDLSNYTMDYVMTPGGRPYMVSTDLFIPESEAYYTMIVSSRCACRISCLAHKRCLSASVGLVDGIMTCRLCFKGPNNTQLQVLQEAAYFYKYNLSRVRYLGLQTDGLLYLLMKSEARWNQASHRCKKFPGHRLGIFRSTDQRKALQTITSVISDAGLWTNMAEDETLPQQKLYKNQVFIEEPKSSEYHFLCQANPSRLEW